MPGRLDGKVAIITGAGAGIGEAIAHKFAREGARLTLVGLPNDPVNEVGEALRGQGAEVEICVGNVAEEGAAQQCVQRTVDRFGELDILINNAGVFLEPAETQDYPVDIFDQTILNNVRSVFLMTKFALPHCSSPRAW